MNTMILKFINSSVVPYCILIGLGLIYFNIENILIRQVPSKEVYEYTATLLANDLRQSIMSYEQNKLENDVFKGGGSKRNNGIYNSIFRVYGELLQEESRNKFVKLMSIARYLDDSFKDNYSSKNITGIDSIDLDILYTNLLSKYGISIYGCGIFTPYNIRSEFDTEHGVYLTQLIVPLNLHRFKLIYRGQVYQINGTVLKLDLCQDDIDKGLMDVIIFDRVTLKKIPYTINITDYAFQV